MKTSLEVLGIIYYPPQEPTSVGLEEAQEVVLDG